MSDTFSPVLLGLALPGVMDVSAGSHAIPVTATAADLGGAGVSRVVVYFDKDLSQTEHHWTGFSSKFEVSGLFTGDSFGDATPGSATSVLSLTKLTRPGTYHVAKVAVEDMAGNRTVYTTSQLQAMGVNTSLKVNGGLDDTVAPALLKLGLPSTVNLGAGQASLALTGEIQENLGGAGAGHATVWFDRPLSFSDGERSSIVLGSPVSSIRTGEPLALVGDSVLSGATSAGTYQVTKVTVTDLAGNTSTYTADQLKSLGINTSLNVTGSAPPSASTTTLSATDTGDGYAVNLASTAWSRSGTDSYKLVLRYDPNMVKFEGAALTQGASGSLSAEVGAGTVTITGTGSFAAASGFKISMDTLRENLWSYLEVEQFSINGTEQAFSKGKSRGMLQGSNGDDLLNITAAGVIDGGAGFDTVMVNGERSSTAVRQGAGGIEVTQNGNTTTLVDVERLAFGEDYLEFGTEGTAAQAYRLYRAAFDRAPDKAGLGFWISQLEHGATLDSVAKGMMQSEEFGAGAGSGSSTLFFVTSLYRNVFDREPDAAGLQYWLNAIDAGGADRAQVLTAFSESGENRAKVLAEIQTGIEYTLW